MLKLRSFIVLGLVFAGLTLSGCGLSLAEDIKPPANYREPVAEEAQPAVESTQFPLVPPDPAQGKLIYVEKCLPCHGETGMGDGPQAANLANPVAPLGSKDLARSSRPVDWYQIVTVGNIEKFMPGFASLSDRERWDVTAYALTLSISQAEVDEGKLLYEQTCAECHGVTGLGDGEQAASLDKTPANWYDQERLAGLSAEDMTSVMEGGIEGHPDFAAQLSEEQRYAVAGYVRALSFTSPGKNPVESASEQELETSQEQPAEAASFDKITISGIVTNASTGGTLPGGMMVTISAYQDMSPAFEVSADVAEDGSYEISDIEFDQNFVYFAQVTANGLTFNSDILHAADIIDGKADLPVQIFETTNAQDALVTDRLHVFFDFTTPGKVQVVNLYIISNLGSQVVIASEQDGPVISFDLPDGAQNLQFQDGELGGRFIQTEKGFGDRLSVMPGSGQHQILFAYDLPYTRKLDLDLKLPLPVEAAIVMMPETTVSLKSSQLVDLGQTDVQGMAYQMYQADSALNAGELIAMELSGGVGSETESSPVSHLLVGALVFGVALAAAGFWLYRQRTSQELVPEPAGDMDQPGVESSETLIDAIVALDDLHASGELPEPAYQERRADLKARLAEALKREA